MVKQTRRDLGMTQRELAKRVGVQASHIAFRAGRIPR
ncbi:MAG: helix-turn-helix domain-containing protein [Candidatus Binataceae bacterium]